MVPFTETCTRRYPTVGLALYQPTEPVTHGGNGVCHCERGEAIQDNQQDR